MPQVGIRGVVRGKKVRTTIPDEAAAKPAELVEAGIEPSVGRVGDSYDYALAETIIGLYKDELSYRPLERDRAGGVCDARLGVLVQ